MGVKLASFAVSSIKQLSWRAKGKNGVGRAAFWVISSTIYLLANPLPAGGEGWLETWLWKHVVFPIEIGDWILRRKIAMNTFAGLFQWCHQV